MKTTIFIALTIIQVLSLQSLAAPHQEKTTYRFQFQPLHGTHYTYETQSDSKEDAYEKAAQSCFQHYKKGRRISQDEGMDIIDICANPRTT